jgi:hypothetical protein
MKKMFKEKKAGFVEEFLASFSTSHTSTFKLNIQYRTEIPQWKIVLDW